MKDTKLWRGRWLLGTGRHTTDHFSVPGGRCCLLRASESEKKAKNEMNGYEMIVTVVVRLVGRNFPGGGNLISAFFTFFPFLSLMGAWDLMVVQGDDHGQVRRLLFCSRLKGMMGNESVSLGDEEICVNCR